MAGLVTSTSIILAASVGIGLFSSGAAAQQSSGYLTDTRGQVVKDPFGLCWRTGAWTPTMATQECDPDLAPRKAAPAKKPAAKPKAPKSAPSKPKPKAKPAAKPATFNPITQKITLEADTLFDFDKAVVKADGKAALDKLAATIKQMNVDAIIAIGHTDRIGSAAYNMKLSQRRADAVKAYLVGKGIAANRIHTEGKGEKQPKTKPGQCKGQKLIACLQPDRRVEVEIVGTRTWSREMVQCLQPDRRVLVELSGMTPVKPKPAAKPKPGAKPSAKPGAKPKGPPKPAFTQLKANVQGSLAWDPQSSVLKPGGQAELNSLLGRVGKAKTTVTVVVITGHNDVIEADKKDRSLSEARAKAVADYLVGKGVKRNLIFTQGIGSSQPVPVTKFCSPA